jgi:Rrf2 family protein
MFHAKSSTYALIAVTEVARQQAGLAEFVQTDQLAKAFDIPDGYLARIMSLLAAAGILRSKRGPTGGFRMGRPPHRITVLDVIQAVDGGKSLQAKIPGVRIQRKLRQDMAAALNRAGEAASKSLAGVTIDQLLGNRK